MKKKVLKLSEFLIENGAYEKFVKNYDPKYKSTIKGVRIDNCFVWEDSAEGFDYWSDIDGKFDNIISGDYVEACQAEYDMNWVREFDELIAEHNEPKVTQSSETEKVETEKESQPIIRSNVTLLSNTHKSGHFTHYLKFELGFDPELSIRYFYKFEDNPNFEGKWVLKHHSAKTLNVISYNVAKLMIKKYCKVLGVEIIGRVNEFGSYYKLYNNKEMLYKKVEKDEKVSN